MTIGIGAVIQAAIIWKHWSVGENLATYDSINLLVASVMVAVLVFLLGDRLLVALGRLK